MPGARSVLVAAAIGLLIASGSRPSAQSPQQGQPQQPATFRSTTDVVAVDVGVIDANGRPIADLRAEEFSLKVDGKPRRISSAEFVSLRGTETNGPSSKVFGSNLGQRPGRLIMFVIDEASIFKGGGKATFKAASKFIDSLNPSDRVALQIIPGAGPLVNFTESHALVKTMIENAVGHAVEADRTGRLGIGEAVQIVERNDEQVLADVLNRECIVGRTETANDVCRRTILNEARLVYNQSRFKTISALSQLRSIIERLGMTPENKTIILISQGLILDKSLLDVSWVADTTSAARVNLYAVRQPAQLYDVTMNRTSPSRDLDQDLMIDGLDNLISRGRGSVWPVAVNADIAFSRLNLEISGYYLLSFEPDARDRDGRTHDIAINVSRRGATVRARREFSADPPNATKTPDRLLTETLRSALSASDFGVKTTAFPYRDDKTGRIKVIISAELDRTLNPSDPFLVGYYVTNTAGETVAANVDKNVPAVPGEEGKPQRFSSAVVLEPGTYAVRLAAVDQKGRRGSVEYTFDANLITAGQLKISALMLGSAGGSTSYKPAVDGRIEAPSLIGYVELYSEAEPPLDNSALIFEVAASDDGRAIEASPMPFSDRKSPGKRTAQAALPTTRLPPGRYVGRVVVSQAGTPIARVTRPFTIDAPTNNAARPAPGRTAMTPLFASRVETFDRAPIVSRQVVGFFLDRMTVIGVPPIPASLSPAIGLARSGRFAEVLTTLEEAKTDHLAAKLLAGIARFAQGDVPAATKDLQAALAIAPSYPPAEFYLGACYAAAGRDADAARVWLASIITDPTAPWIYTELIDAFVRLKDAAQALQLVDEATKIWPDDDDVLMRQAVALALAGQGDRASKVLDPFLVRHPDDADRLVLGMRLIYDARVAGQPIESTAVDRDRFVRYFEAYKKLNGSLLGQAEEWKRLVDR